MVIAVVMAANPVDILGLVYARRLRAEGRPRARVARPRQRRVLGVRDRGHDPQRRRSSRIAIITAAI